MNDLTVLERRLRAANPVPDPSRPPMPTISAVDALLDIEARSIDMQTHTDIDPDRSDQTSHRTWPRLAVAAAVAALVVAAGALWWQLDDDEAPAVPPPATVSVEEFCAMDPVGDIGPEGPESIPPGDAAAVRQALLDWAAVAPPEIKVTIDYQAQVFVDWIDLWVEYDFDSDQVDMARWNDIWERFVSAPPDIEDEGWWYEENCP